MISHRPLGQSSKLPCACVTLLVHGSLRSCECACLPNAWAHGCDLARCECAFCQTHGRLGVISPSGLFGSKDQKPRLLRLFACCCKRKRNWNIFDCFQCCTPRASENINWCPTQSENNNGFPTACFCKHIVEIFGLAITYHQVSWCSVFSFFHRFPSFSTCFTSFTSSPAPIVFIFMHIVSSLFHSCFDRPDWDDKSMSITSSCNK